MKMKRAMLICLFIGLTAFVLISCTDDYTQAPVTSPSKISKTLAQQFIDTVTLEELNKIIIWIQPVTINHKDNSFLKVNEMTSWDLFNFYVNNFDENSDQWFRQSDQSYHVPLQDVLVVLDQYFEEYSFDPRKISSEVDLYNEQEDTIVVSAYGLSFYSDFEVKNLKAVSDNEVEIEIAFYDRLENSNSNDVLYKVKLTLKITVDGYKYISYVKF